MKSIIVVCFLAIVFFADAQDLQKYSSNLVYSTTVNLTVQISPNSILTLYSLNGTYVGKWEAGTASFVTIEWLPEGTYLAEISSKEETIRKRIIVLQ